jgi:hypothetical protein
MKIYYESRRSKTGMKCFNVTVYKAHIAAGKGNCPTTPAFSTDLAPCDFFLLSKLKFHLYGKRYKSQNAHGSVIYQ